MSSTRHRLLTATAATAATAVGAASVALWRRVAARSADRTEGGDRWLTVTVNRPPEEIDPGDPPEPLRKYADRIEVRTRPAPGGRGTELAARLRGGTPPVATSPVARLAGEDPRQDVRRALRDAKALLEAGEVLEPDAPPTTRDTPGGRLVGLVTRRSGGEGVL
ncbi:MULTISPECIES: hypothetical protein [Streptomyces]|uniref:Uncharacterized protein n=2 Tax=Streptomyces TaxID=1883 RepID=A0A124EDB2_9ACTN|nr:MULTISPECIES: hypothetical protein [Streptomyces]KUH40206.1 hypothetical protein ATE80_02565 [Streptomyces kanasensis]UUS34190.1 hypothetical protein NRO40_27420 [Streptomyces changanensis]